MKIYTVTNDVENYRWAMPKDEAVWGTDALFFGGKKKLESWSPIDFYVDNPLLKKGNAIHIAAGVIAYDKFSVDKLSSFLEMSGELLPIVVDGESYYLHNVTEVINALNDDDIVWNVHQGVKTHILKYAFHKSRMSESSLFKVPETVNVDIYAYSGLKDPEDEFYSMYHTLGLEGLIFEEV